MNCRRYNTVATPRSSCQRSGQNRRAHPKGWVLSLWPFAPVAKGVRLLVVGHSPLVVRFHPSPGKRGRFDSGRAHFRGCVRPQPSQEPSRVWFLERARAVPVRVQYLLGEVPGRSGVPSTGGRAETCTLGVGAVQTTHPFAGHSSLMVSDRNDRRPGSEGMMILRLTRPTFASPYSARVD